MPNRIDRALVLLQQSRYDLAAKELRLALAADPDDPTAHALLSQCLTRLGDPAAGTEEAERAVACGPDQSLGFYALAMARLERNHFPEADAAAREAVRLDPTAADHHALLAAVRAGSEDWVGVLAAADEGLSHDPVHEWCTNLRAMALIRLGRRAEAGATIEDALGRDPDSAFTHANRGWALLHEGDPGRALEHFREALRRDPELDHARAGMVEALKARYWAYRQVLRFFLWMSRLSPGARVGVIVGLFVLQRVVVAVANANPALDPVLTPVLVGYLVFVVATWLAVPLSNLALRLNRFGRLALSTDQQAGSLWVGAVLAVSAGWAVYAAATDPNAVAVHGAFTFLLLALPVSLVHACEPGWPRRAAAGYAAAVLALIVTGLGLLASGFELAESDLPAALDRIRVARGVLGVVPWAVLASGLLSGWLTGARPRR